MSGSGPAPEGALAPVLEQVGPGVWAYVQPDGSWFLNNSAFFVGEQGVVLVDTTSTERRSRALLGAVASVTDRPVRTLFNTHHHSDHSYGNWLLPGATILGQHRCREEMIASGLGGKAMFPDVEWGHIEVAPPFVTFDEQLTIWVDDLEVQVRHFGVPAHSSNDAIAWVPSQRLLIAGDLVFNGGTPLAMQGSVAGWLQVLPQLRSLGAERVVPGHGPVCEPDVFDRLERYLRWVQEVAADGLAAGWTALEAAQRAADDMGEFAGWGERERLAPNLHRAYSEARGEPWGHGLATPALIADMVTFNGGQLPHCLA